MTNAVVEAGAPQHRDEYNRGEIYAVRVMEGFSSEEGFPAVFGATMFEGQATLGVAPVAADGSWSALVPANIPVHMQAVDVFGMSLFNEPVWVSGRPGEAQICGGCHEDRAGTTNVSSDRLRALTTGASKLMGTVPRASRLNLAPATAADVVGVGWTTQVQPIFDANCISCHDGASGPANPTYTTTDATTGQTFTWTFNLKGDPLPPALATVTGGASYSASYFTMVGPDLEAVEQNKLMLSGSFKVYMNPEDASGSALIRELNPTKLFPSPGTVRAFGTTPHLFAQGKPT